MRVSTLVTAGSGQAREAAMHALAQGDEVFTSGFDVVGAQSVGTGFGSAVHDTIFRAHGEVLLVDVPIASREAFLRPLEDDRADVVNGARSNVPLLERAANALARLTLGDALNDPLSGSRAFRLEALKAEPFSLRGDDAEAEVLVKLSAQQYRFADAPVTDAPPRSTSSLAQLSRTFARYATLQNDADNTHEGYSNLAHLEAGAPNYNTWLASTFDRYAGQRVLEIGAGIGTITSHLTAGRELVTALEMDPFYVRRLKNRFRGQPQVEPYQGDIAMADWKGLQARRFDTIVLSNVLEHIPDDAGAVATFARILPVGGSLILYVPAIEQLFGSIDEAVGHHRRYTMESLRRVLEENGFEVDTLKWMNLIGIPAWFMNGRIFKRRVLPPLQLRIYDQLAPTLAQLESKVTLPVGLSLLAVGKRR